MMQQNSEHSHMKGLMLQRYANYIDLYLDEVNSCDKNILRAEYLHSNWHFKHVKPDLAWCQTREINPMIQ